MRKVTMLGEVCNHCRQPIEGDEYLAGALKIEPHFNLRGSVKNMALLLRWCNINCVTAWIQEQAPEATKTAPNKATNPS
jgi:hypothetical protein